MKPHRKAVYLIIKRGNQYLLANSAYKKNEEWYFPGGGVDPGESELEAFYRESYEELGLRKEDFISVTNTGETLSYEWPLWQQEKSEFVGQEKTFVVGEISPSAVIDITITGELDGVRWVEKEELVDHIPFTNLKNRVLELYDIL